MLATPTAIHSFPVGRFTRQAFRLSQPETRFYEALLDYLRDGYNLAEASGNKGRALGFVMTIFQKIAASSFAAVRATLRRRLLNLTIHEAIVCDQNLDVDGRERALPMPASCSTKCSASQRLAWPCPGRSTAG